MSNISHLKSNSREDNTVHSNRTRPQEQPRNDNFRKSMKDRPPSKKDVEEHHVEDHEEPRSVFDLSKSKTKSKPNLTSKSTLKDSESSDSLSNRPVTPKQDLSEQEQGSQEDAFVADGSEMSQSADDFYATAQETPALPQDQITKQTKPPVQQPLDGLKPEQAAASIQKPRVSRDESSFETSESRATSKKQKSGKSEESKSDTSSEIREGVAGPAVNASIQSAGFHSEKIQETQETTRSATIRDIATQIVDRIQVMRKDNETLTTITLRNPPILEGATITLTTSDHAKREFNIAFANLSPDAKIFLDRKLREDSLTDRLKNQDITVHMLTTSTQSENIITADAGQTSRDRQDQQQEQQQQQQRRQNFQRPEEEEE